MGNDILTYARRVLHTAFWGWARSEGGMASFLTFVRSGLVWFTTTGTGVASVSRSEILQIPDPVIIGAFVFLVFGVAPFSVWYEEKQRADRAEDGLEPKEEAELELLQRKLEQEKAKDERFARRAQDLAITLRSVIGAWEPFFDADEEDRAAIYVNARSQTLEAKNRILPRLAQLSDKALSRQSQSLVDAASTIMASTLDPIAPAEYSRDMYSEIRRVVNTLDVAAQILQRPMNNLGT